MRICFFGDSFTNGTGDDTCLGWVGRVCAEQRQRGVDLTAYNLGVRRDTSGDILRRWRVESEARLPAGYDRKLVFAFGNNDAASNDRGNGGRLDSRETHANAVAILSEARLFAPTLVIGPLPVLETKEENLRVATVSKCLSEVCADLTTPYLDLMQRPHNFWTIWRAEAVRGDGVHPNAEGYRLIATAVSDWAEWRQWF